ncbi:MAG TPA: hypothetical protein VND93_29605 [Myxococcales bacterium]|nr:hypothetical protein [Myxococcales bacterium]
MAAGIGVALGVLAACAPVVGFPSTHCDHDSDCGLSTLKCDNGQCVERCGPLEHLCPGDRCARCCGDGECRADEYCDANAGTCLPRCLFPEHFCGGRCVQCCADRECRADERCDTDAGACVDRCTFPEHLCGGRCAQCCADRECRAGERCDTDAGACVNVCPGQRYCPDDGGTCQQCCGDQDCGTGAGSGFSCVQGTCTCPLDQYGCNGSCISVHSCCDNSACEGGFECDGGACCDNTGGGQGCYTL